MHLDKEASMGELKAYYDCQVCKEKHELKARWTKKSEKAIAKSHGVDIKKETKRTLFSLCKTAFTDEHPGEKFDPSRLYFE